MRRHSIQRLALALGVALAVSASVAEAAVPHRLMHQGRLFDAEGVPVDAIMSVTFSIYADEDSPTPLWTETVDIAFDDGYFSASLGDVTPLLEEPEDRFVILGSGDSLHLRFDASGVPPVPEGYRRDYLVYLDGWAKDRDPNAVDCEFVEPMPFHGMSGFPYGPNESFPDSPEHRAWAAEWNTRDARTWIEPLAPGR